MVKEGVPQESLKRIHAPIGVPIATDTPEEIAISIMAEIVDVRRQNKKKIKAAEKTIDNETSDSH
jgi:xanthine dehydrogenase accessory factor